MRNILQGEEPSDLMRHQITLLLFPALLFGMVNTGFGQCLTNGAGVSGLAVVTVSDTGVTFRWTSLSSAQNYEYAVTTDSSYTGYTGDTNFVYYLNYTPDTFASQAP